LYKSVDLTLQSFLQKQTWKCGNDVTLYRAVFGPLAKSLMSAKPGDVFTNPGYSSTAFDPRYSMSFDKSNYVLLSIKVPNGTPFPYIDGVRDDLCRSWSTRRRQNIVWFYQSEVIFDKNTSMKILRKTKPKSKTFRTGIPYTKCGDAPFEMPDVFQLIHVEIVQ
jgi:hypothetical protein